MAMRHYYTCKLHSILYSNDQMKIYCQLPRYVANSIKCPHSCTENLVHSMMLCILKKSRKKCRPLAELPHAQSSLNASPQSSQQRSEERIPRLSRRDGTPYPGVQGIRETPKRRQRTTANTRRT
ncbi:UNVERIFIED_CONTAM: hypothetical protein NCL1_32974 [Trichonephila clavipes]